jgi:tRNA/tmRNA/rRNA uracil-C5-methylase (TrmA/RlmC/RlmD family)
VPDYPGAKRRPQRPWVPLGTLVGSRPYHTMAMGLVVADPSRAGLGREVVDRIAATGAAAVVLVACDPAAFGRDAGLLSANGYRLDAVTLVDLFPHTPHVEVVGAFRREERPSTRSSGRPVGSEE